MRVGGRPKKPAKYDDEPVAGPVRRCAVSRARRDRDDLIRFVAGPDGTVIPDLALKLPGRGVWVSAEKSAIAEAAKTRAFSMGFKRAVEASTDLADELEKLLVDRAVQALSIVNKAGQVISGFDKVSASLSTRSVSGLVHGADAASDGRNKLDRKYMAIAQEKGQKAQIVDCLTVSQLSLAMGRSNVVHAALTTGGAAVRFFNEARRLQRYRTGYLDTQQLEELHNEAS